MQSFNRRRLLKTFGISAIALGLGSTLGALKRGRADDIDWFQSINRIKDPITLTPKEKGHAPFVQIPGVVKSGEPFIVDVQIGETLHPMTAGHYIQWIEVYLGTDLISRVEFSPLCPQAKVTIPVAVKESSTLRILSRCNLHGIWETVKTVAV